jgi:glutathione synthase
MQVGGDVVLKPLDGFGGRSVFLVRGDDPNLVNLIRSCTEGGRRKIVVQEVIKGHSEGDKRIILLDGEPIGCILRKNLGGGFVHNLAAGGTAIPTALTDSDRKICDAIRQKLLDEEQFFVGIDIIGGLLVEINVTSPTGLVEINKAGKESLEMLVVDFIESKIL